MRAGHHFNIYLDLYGGRVFRPRGFMEVAYGEKTVHRGTILSPTEVNKLSPVYMYIYSGGAGELSNLSAKYGVPMHEY